MKAVIDNTYVSPPNMVFEHTKVVFKDEEGHEGYLLIPTELVDSAGLDYIRDHTSLEWSSFCEEWFARLSFNDFYNDVERNPLKTIEVKFVGIQEGTGREIYKDIDDRYFLRENIFPRERFARWYACGKRLPTGDDGDEVRPNLIFCCDGQQEKVRYDDWNGVAAYSDTFNEEFHKK